MVEGYWSFQPIFRNNAVLITNDGVALEIYVENVGTELNFPKIYQLASRPFTAPPSITEYDALESDVNSFVRVFEFIAIRGKRGIYLERE